MHRQTIFKMCEAACVNYCDTSCCCGENNRLIWDSWPVTDMPEWVPGWVNGCCPEDLYEWMKQEARNNQEIRQAMKNAGMRVPPANKRLHGDPHRAA